GEREPVLVDEHRLVAQPRGPRLLRDVLVDPLAELARVRRKVQSLGLAAELHAVDHSCHSTSPRASCDRPATCAGSCRGPASGAAGPRSSRYGSRARETTATSVS